MSELPPINQKYGIDTTDFKTGLAAMKREISVLDSAWRASAAGMGDWADTATGLESRIEALNKLIDVQKGRVAATRSEYERLAKEKGANSAAAKDMEVRLNKETEQLNKYEHELGQSRTKLGEMEKATDHAADELNHLERETGGAIQGLDKLKGVVGGLGTALKIGIAGMIGLAGAVVAVGAGITKLVTGAAETAGELVDLSEKTGITVERLQELAYVGDQVGVGADTMVGAMEKMVRSMGTARDQIVDFQQASGEASEEAAQKALEIEEDFAASSGKVQAKLIETEKESGQERESLRQKLEKSLAEIARDTYRDLEKLEQQHLSKMAGLQASIGKVETDFEYDSAERKEDTTRELTRMEEDYNHDREKLMAELGEAETEAEKKRVQARIDELDYEYNTTKKRREEDAAEAQADAEHAKNERIKALQEQLAAETAEYQKQNIELQAQQAEQQQAAQARYQEELKAVQERYAGEVSAAAQALDEIAAKRADAMKAITSDKELGDQAKAWQKLGVSVVDADGNLRDMQTVFNEALTALGGIENATERDALAMAIFGKSAMDLNPMIKAGADEIARLSQEAHDAGAVMSTETVQDLEAFGDKVAGLTAGLKGTMGEVAGAFEPLFKSIADQAGVYLGQFGEIVRGADGDLVKMADGIGKLLGQILTDFAKQGPQLLEGGLQIVQGILNAITENLPMLLDGAVQIITMLVKFLVDNLPTIIDAGVQILLTLVNAIIDNLPIIVEAGIEALLALIDGLAEAMPKLIPAITDAMLLITEILIEHLPELVEAGGKLLVAIAEGLAAALPTLIEKTPELIKALADALIALLPILANIGMEMLKTVAGAIVENLPELGAAAGKLVVYFGQAMADLGQTIWEVGKNIVIGVWTGIKENAGWFFDQVKGFFLDMVGASKDALQEHSPSRVFAAIGENAGSSYVDSLGAALKDGTRRLQLAFGETALVMDAQTPAGAGSAAAGQTLQPSGDTWNVTINHPAQTPADIASDIRFVRLSYGEAR